ncbi:MAG: ornithine--oxo-acid transaminase [Nitrospina sp.]|jgi:ornithine--oxo-acid transaminase|nr:ornithine--oxo-acid transaminase [Nitrospina sp.]MBT3857791.1 ornithine--oxo-acid transaminase [Nitrospina sp.]MBT4103394.1 ornithine--oxo-acid transaminase [Nitrospina sp.]MBT4390441.1 ornithine--oxo-acid transaminase [Nitrospina sp.]MBT4619490.1 ornithine--oxo-acid transaminase [Nitrospina sp.]
MDSTVTLSNAQSFIELENEFGARNYAPLDVVLARGQGVWVWDVEDNKYLDMLASYSALNQGHCHPRILTALIEQAKKLTLVSRAFRTDQLGPFYKEICEMTHSHSVLPMNSGAEAVETALKAARKWGYKVKEIPENMAEIIVCANNFHGRTITIVGFSTESQYRDGFGPFAPGFVTIPFGDAEALEWAITPNTVAFLVEPIQGEGGIIIPPAGYLKKVREICDRHNVLLILDEIQTGLGRTGKLFAEEHEGIESDLTLVGKALSGGFYPISAVLSNKEALSVFNPGDHGSTFGGNPLACAVAREALKIIKDENLIENSMVMGNYLIQNLNRLSSPYIKEVRGKGLLVGVELKKSAGGARRFCEALMEKGILCKETHKHVIRFAPPLTITKEELDWALERIEPVLCP